MMHAMSLLLVTFIVSIGINLVMFIPAYVYKTDKLTDISYSITFAVVALAGFITSSSKAPHMLITLLVLLWAVRLGAFLFARIRRVGKDSRFDGMREDFLRFLKFWLLQGLSVWVIMLAALLGYTESSPRLTALSWVGLCVFGIGLFVESVADSQKRRFKDDPNNKGKWIDAGVWRMSRHPNYLGEMMVWVGLYLVVVPSLSFVPALVALLSPLYIITLLSFVSGIPLLEKSAQEKWGSQKEFQRYKSEVPVLIPTLRSLRRVNYSS
jgi:steroid 5-alpha reductase family enzyme